VESLYLLWRTTGERRWREYAWRIFESIEKHTKTESGYASVKIEGNGDLVKKNEMPRYVRLVLFDEPLAERIRLSLW
jgi:mannosyl-oligosaccharide alpha-1,2-mannosidase